MLKVLRLTYFPLCILITSLLMLPICLIRPRSYKNTGLYLMIFSYLTKPLGLSIKVNNFEILKNCHPSILIGNHQHNMDMWAVSSVFQNRVVALGKKELIYIPFFGIVFWLTGNIIVNRGNKESSIKSLKKAENFLKKKRISVVIFPEGTRNPTNKLLPFKKGAFITAINAQLPITIFAISRYPNIINFNKLSSGEIQMSFLEPISTIGLTEKDIPMLMQKCRGLLEDEIQRIS